MIGKTIAHYDVLEKLGEGGMGVVYKARDTHLDRFVAIKVLPAEKVADPDRRARFVQEAKSASALNHPNIVTIHDIGRQDGVDFMAMEFVAGKTLGELIPRKGMRLNEALKIAVQVADALAAAHEAGIIHRDLKPGNIIVGDDGRVRVLDFGLAKLTEVVPDTDETRTLVADEGPHTKEGMIVGTASYMSPEQAEGKKVDARSDIFSFGSVLYEMVTGRRPFAGDSSLATLAAVINKEPEPLPGDVQPELRKVVKRCLRKDLSRRFQHMDDIKIALEDLKDETDSGSLSGIPSDTAPHRRLAPWLAALLSVAVLLVGAGWWWQHRADPPDARSPEASIAVMPFVNQSPDPDSEYFSDGMTDELINALTQVEGLKVVARSSVFRFKDEDYSIKTVGEKLGVGSVLEGTVRKAGNRLRITAQLTSVADGFNLWSQSFDREMKDVFDVQEEVCRAMVETFKVRLVGDSEELLIKRYTGNIEAYNLYLRGRRQYYRFTSADMKLAVQYFEQAKQLDPDYPLPYVGIGAYYATTALFGTVPPRGHLARAEAELRRALEIDPNLALAYSYLGSVQHYRFDWAAAEAAHLQAIALAPRSASTHSRYAQFLADLGRAEEAIAAGTKAVELDPVHITANYHLAKSYVVAGDYDQAVRQARISIELEPHNFLTHFILGVAEWRRGRQDEAIQSFERSRALGAGSPLTEGALGNSYAASGRREEAEEILAKMLQRREKGYVSGVTISWVYAGFGELDQWVFWLETAFEDGDPLLGVVLAAPTSDPLQSDPRYLDLMKRLDFPE